MSAARPALRLARRAAAVPIARRPFHASARACVKVGDAIPSVELYENSPGNKVNIADAIKGRTIIIGVPAAFSPACSETHIPGYVSSPNLKGVDSVFVISVNDPFVMKAWAASLDPAKKIRFLADPHLAFTNAMDLAFDGTAIFGGPRSKRYALVVEDGKVKEAHVESDNIGLDVSAAAKVLRDSW